MAKKTKRCGWGDCKCEACETAARELSKRTGWCLECARSGCAQGYCCGALGRRFVDSDTLDD